MVLFSSTGIILTEDTGIFFPCCGSGELTPWKKIPASNLIFLSNHEIKSVLWKKLVKMPRRAISQVCSGFMYFRGGGGYEFKVNGTWLPVCSFPLLLSMNGSLQFTSTILDLGALTLGFLFKKTGQILNLMLYQL